MTDPMFGGRRWVLMAIATLALVGATATQRSETCSLTRAGPNQNLVNVSCSCNQRLTQTRLRLYKVAHLSINQTGCSNRRLELRWPDLEIRVAPETLVLHNSHVLFAEHQPNTVWNSSITKLSFVDSSFDFLPAHAFGGMKLLEEIRFLGGTIGEIRSNAFSGLQQLKVIEIANATVKNIESRAFTDLPSLEDLTIVRSKVDNVESEAVFLPRHDNDEVRRCTNIGRSSSSRSHDFLRDIMARQLSSTVNLPLPGYGSRFLLLNNTIQTLNTRAVTSETFGFLIVGGNHIENVHARAFSMELYNECEISAPLFIGNTITNLGSSALAGLKGREGISYQTVIAISNNVFLSVAQEGFLLDKSMGVFSIGENKFHCACDKFDWILSNANSQNQQELEREMLLGARCLDGTELISFTLTCIDHGASTTMLPTSTARPTIRPTVLQPSSAQAHSVSLASVTASVLTLILCRTFM